MAQWTAQCFRKARAGGSTPSEGCRVIQRNLCGRSLMAKRLASTQSSGVRFSPPALRNYIKWSGRTVVRSRNYNGLKVANRGRPRKRWQTAALAGAICVFPAPAQSRVRTTAGYCHRTSILAWPAYLKPQRKPCPRGPTGRGERLKPVLVQVQILSRAESRSTKCI